MCADRNGLLNCSELYGALDWLGLIVTPEDIYEIMKNIDRGVVLLLLLLVLFCVIIWLLFAGV